MKPSVLFVGFGQIASKVHLALANDVKADVVKKNQDAEIGKRVSTLFIGDVAQSDTWQKMDGHYDYIVYCVTPRGRDEDAYRAVFYEGLVHCINYVNAQSCPAHILFVSSTSVFAQKAGETLTELSEAIGASATSKVLVASEKLLADSGLPHTVVRFSGIYGGTRTRLIEQVAAGNPVLSDEVRISNRIHEQDAVGFLECLIRKLMTGEQVDRLYLATDMQPSNLNEVYAFIADQLNLTLNPVKIEEGAGRRSGNKTISNKRMLSTGFELSYPDFRDGYAEMCARFVKNSE